MGTWGVGMQASDHAWDVLPMFQIHPKDADGEADYSKEPKPLPREEAHKGFLGMLVALKKKKSEKYERQEVLAVADYLIEVGHGLPEAAIQKVVGIIDVEIKNCPGQGWHDPQERIEALNRFRGLVKGERRRGLDDEVDNAGLFCHLLGNRKAIKKAFGKSKKATR